MRRPELSLQKGGDGRLQEVLQLEGDPFRDADARAPLHQDGIDGSVYRAFLSGLGEQSGFMEGTALAYARDLIDSMKPRDAMERTLVVHALWCHGRVMKLNLMLARTIRLHEVKTLSELIDRASNDFRKSMVALVEYRRPRRRALKFIAQQNNARQQIVQNGGGDGKRTKRVAARKLRALPPAPVHEGRSRRATGRDSADKALAPVNRTTKRRG